MAKQRAVSSKKSTKPKTAKLLVRMRNEKLHLAMNHKTLEEYAQNHLSPEKEKALDGLRKKALKGELRDGAVVALKKGSGGSRKAGFKRLISKLRAARQVAVELSFITPDIVGQIDATIEMVKNLMAVKTASFERLDILLGKGNGPYFS